MNLQKQKILLVEDDENLGFLLKDNLEMAGYDVYLEVNGDAGYKTFIRNNIDLCILDVMLPKKDGFQLATEIREINLKVPIVFLTAKSLKEDKIKGFKTGGDDYITKPFSLEELLLRIEAILKRTYKTSEKKREHDYIRIGKSVLNHNNLLLVVDGKEEKLTYREAKLLKLLLDNKNMLLERDHILKAVWEDEGVYVSRSLDVFISRLRKRLKADPSVQITSVHGIGYKLIEGLSN